MRFIYALVLLPCLAQARVFDYKDSGIAPYIRGTGGLSQLNQDAFANSSGNSTVNGSSKYNYGAEIGLMLGLSQDVHFRLGAEIIQESPVNGQGVDSSGSALYTINSTVFIFNPNAALEFVLNKKGNTRFYFQLGAGYANVAVTNAYTMTSAGQTALGVGSFTENLYANTISGNAGFGMETLFTDNVTFLADLDYRYLPVTSLKYKSGVTNIVSPSGVSAGAPVVNGDGSARKLNLSGIYAGVAFRFYLKFL